MSDQNKINRILLRAWQMILVILFCTYLLEVIKGQRTILYLAILCVFWFVPEAVCMLWYRRDNNNPNLRYGIAYGYLIGYAFCLFTSHSDLTFVYVLPLLSTIILYHDAKLVLQLGAVSIGLNLIAVVQNIMDGSLMLQNFSDAEIKILSMVMCFAGCYFASKLYDELHHQSEGALKQVREMSLQTIGVIANTVDAKDSNTEGHSRRVATYSYALAKKLGCSEEEAENIRTIGLLHDIGKIGIPDSVLHKPGKLTDDEYRIMKMHPTIGANILKDIPGMDGLAVGARYHHERIDGKGYPDGLKGDEIPFVARLICVADCFDAMHSNRIYRSRFSMNYILNELRENKGTQFDPKIADAMISLIEQNELPGVEAGGLTATEEITGDGKDSVLANGAYLLDEIATKNSRQRNALGTISTEDWSKSFRQHVQEKLLTTDGRLFIVDVDNMHQINDTYGFAVGDNVLQTIYKILSEKKDIMTSLRSGGDEFVCWVETPMSEMEYHDKLESLRQDIRDHIETDTKCRNISLSIGATSSMVSGRDYETMRADAYKALYYVKKIGKDGLDIYANGKTSAVMSKTAVEHDLNTIAGIIASEHDYHGAYHTDYEGFEKIYNLLRNVSSRYLENVQLILFTMQFDTRTDNVSERDVAMNILESAIIGTLRKTDVTTRYSTTQQLLLLMNINDENMKMISDRIMKEFYRMYDKGNVTLVTSSKNVSMAKMKHRQNNTAGA